MIVIPRGPCLAARDLSRALVHRHRVAFGAAWVRDGNTPSYLTISQFMTDSHFEMATAALASSGERRRQRHREEVRARLLTAAADLFSRHGIANTRVETITEAADVAKGTFFNYFVSKEAVAVELAKGVLTDLWIVAQRARQADSVRPILAGLPQVLLDSLGRSPALLRSLLGVMLLHDELQRDFLEIENMARSHLAHILERGQELGEIRRSEERRVGKEC